MKWIRSTLDLPWGISASTATGILVWITLCCGALSCPLWDVQWHSWPLLLPAEYQETYHQNRAVKSSQPWFSGGRGRQRRPLMKSTDLDESIQFHFVHKNFHQLWIPYLLHHKPEEITLKTILEGFTGLEAIFLLGCGSLRAKFTLFYIRTQF